MISTSAKTISVKSDFAASPKSGLTASLPGASCFQMETLEGRMLQLQKDRASFKRQTAYTFTYDALDRVSRTSSISDVSENAIPHDRSRLRRRAALAAPPSRLSS